MTTIVTPLAFSSSATIGVLFGINPSMQAADMDPMEALRHELFSVFGLYFFQVCQLPSSGIGK
jgi:hypothetical protein